MSQNNNIITKAKAYFFSLIQHNLLPQTNLHKIVRETKRESVTKI